MEISTPTQVAAVRISGDIRKGFSVEIPLAEFGVESIENIDTSTRAFRFTLLKNGVNVNVSEDGLEIDGLIPLDESSEEIETLCASEVPPEVESD